MCNSANTNKVTVFCENGFAYHNATDNINFGQRVQYVSTPSVRGSQFLGWFDENQNLINQNPIFTQNFSGNVCYTAKYAYKQKEQDTLSKAEITKALQKKGYYEPFFERSIVFEGNNVLLARVIKKLRKGENITLVGFGGSITQFAAATTVEQSYTYLVKQRLEQKYGVCVNYHNAGIGATTSILGISRIKEHVLEKKPDIVLLDFTTNDILLDYYAASYEAIVRTLAENNIATVAIMFGPADKVEYPNGVFKRADNRRDYHLPSLIYYGVPVIDYYHAMWDNYLDLDGDGVNSADDIAHWNALWGDYIHPNNAGHNLAANAILYYLSIVDDKCDTIADTEQKLPDDFFFALTEKYMGSTRRDCNDIAEMEIGISGGVFNESYTNKDANTFSQWSPWIINEGEYVEFLIKKCRSFSWLRVLSNTSGSADVYINGKFYKNDNAYDAVAFANWIGDMYFGDGSDITVKFVGKGGKYSLTNLLFANN